MSNNYCVYKHTSPSEKVYIGITSMNPCKRWKNGKGYELCTAFNRAIQKYGWSNFKHEILFEGLCKEDACKKEQELIAEYDSANPEHGYNLTSGGEHYEPNAEWRDRLSASLKRAFAEHPEYGKHLSEIQKGRKQSEESNKKRSIKMRKYYAEHPEARERCGNSFRGKKRSKENCEKLSAANKVKVRCVENDMVFSSVEDAAAFAGVCRTSVTNMLRGRSKTAGGFKFEYYTVGGEDNAE